LLVVCFCHPFPEAMSRFGFVLLFGLPSQISSSRVGTQGKSALEANATYPPGIASVCPEAERDADREAAGLPACPCTAMTFCNRKHLVCNGVGCVESADSVASQGYQVQCVPGRNGGIKYYCPKLLPTKCNPDLTPTKCDFSAYGKCSPSSCDGGYMLKKMNKRARFCAMKMCTRGECCSKCPPSKFEGGKCMYDQVHPTTHKKTGRKLVGPKTCCQKPSVIEGNTCEDKIRRIISDTYTRYHEYEDSCHFNAIAHVNMGQSTFTPTKIGMSKITDEKCSHVQFSELPPEDVHQTARALAANDCPGEAAFEKQLSPAGIFAATASLDRIWLDTHSASWSPASANEGEFSAFDSKQDEGEEENFEYYS